MSYPLSPSQAAAVISAFQELAGLCSGTGAAAAISGTPAQLQAKVSALLAIMNPPLQYVEVALTDGTPASGQESHGLGRNPIDYYAMLHCVTNDAGSGIVAGQEFSPFGLLNAVGTTTHSLEFSGGYDSFNLYWGYSGGAGSGWGIPWGSTAIASLTSFSNFTLRLYYK